MVTPSLRLAFHEGPRGGDALQCNPGSTIRVGRIARGNEIAVNEAGISTKHLLIASVSSGKWLIEDLGSSNGTLLNSIALNPFAPRFLRDGDIIEIGKCTSIVVNFVTDVLEQKLPKSPDISEEDMEFEDKPSSRVRKARKIEISEKLEMKEEDRVQRNRSCDSCVNAIEVEAEDAKNSMDTTTRSKNIETVAEEAEEEAIKEKSVTVSTRSNKNETQTPNQMSSNDFSVSTERSFNEETSVNNGSGFSLGSVSSSAFHPNRDQLLEIERLKQLLREKDAKIEELAKQTSKIRQELEGPNTFLVFMQKKFPASFRPMR